MKRRRHENIAVVSTRLPLKLYWNGPLQSASGKMPLEEPFVHPMPEDFQAVQMNDGDMLVVEVEPLFVSGRSDIHAFQIKADVNANALDHIPCRTAQCAIGLCEKRNTVHDCAVYPLQALGTIRALMTRPDSTAARASLATERL